MVTIISLHFSVLYIKLFENPSGVLKFMSWLFSKFKMAAKMDAKSRSNMIFQQMKLGTSAIPHFHVILTGQSISRIILNIQGHLQGQKVNFKVK